MLLFPDRVGNSRSLKRYYRTIPIFFLLASDFFRLALALLPTTACDRRPTDPESLEGQLTYFESQQKPQNGRRDAMYYYRRPTNLGKATALFWQRDPNRTLLFVDGYGRTGALLQPNLSSHCTLTKTSALSCEMNPRGKKCRIGDEIIFLGGEWDVERLNGKANARTEWSSFISCHGVNLPSIPSDRRIYRHNGTVQKDYSMLLEKMSYGSRMVYRNRGRRCYV